MSAIPIPQPKTAAGRPPFDPPKSTTFDPTPGDSSREPMYKVLSDSVRFLLSHLLDCQPDQASLMYRLITERKKLVEKELKFERMMAPEVLPPTLKNLYALDFVFEENDAVRVYTRLLDNLDQAEHALRSKFGDQKQQAPASDL